nr:MAG TPA: hypothetical protein [Caudoviricetes sp.]
MPNNNTLREFSYSRPITYKGVPYPSVPANILTDGQQTPVNVFTDTNGNYYVLDDNGSAKSVMPVHTLDEVVVTPSKENLLSAQFNEYLTQSNDKTQVLNSPHREYNSHLKTKFLEGARYHAAWEKEHPNLTAWSQAFSTVPFAVASAPLVGALGQSALATTAGQAARAGIASLMSNPIVEAANTGLGLGFAAKGAYDVSQGDFTPETAMDLAGGAGLMFKSLTGLNRARRAAIFAKSSESVSSNIDTPLKGLTRIPTDIKADAAQRYTNFINSEDYQQRLQRAELEDHWNYIKNLTDERINRKDYFPGIIKEIVNNDPRNNGMALPYDGIVLKSNLKNTVISPVLNHEVSHWATRNIGTNRIMNWIGSQAYGEDVTPIGDIMRHNENIVHNIPWRKVKKQIGQPGSIIRNKGDYKYLTQSQEKRARAYSIYQQVRDSGKSIDDFIDYYTTDNNKIATYAPEQLREIGEILTPNNIKKYLRNFLSIGAPIEIVGLKQEE